MRRTLAPAIIALAVFAAVPATAQDVASVMVTYGDLDLANPAGVQTLQHRVARAVTAVCGIPDAMDLNAVRASNACRKQAVARSTPQVAAAVDKSIQTALGGTGKQVASR